MSCIWEHWSVHHAAYLQGAVRWFSAALEPVAVCRQAMSRAGVLDLVAHNAWRHCGRAQSLPYILGLAGLGGGLYYAKQQGMLDAMLGAPPSGVGSAKVRLPAAMPSIA